MTSPLQSSAATTSAPAPDAAPLAPERRRTREFVSTFWRTVALRGGVLAFAMYGATLWFGRELFGRLTLGELALVGLAALSFAFTLLGLVVVFLIVPLVSRPTARLAAVTEAVAAGDLSIKIIGRNGTGEMVRLWKAVGEMIAALRNMALALRSSAAETAALAGEINAGTEHMSAAAQQMASTSAELSVQSTEMASTIQQMAADAASLVAISAELAAGAQDGVARNAQLRALAQENRARLDSSVHTLGELADDVRSSAAAVEAVASASEEVRAFVAYVQKMARQSKLLALNAAMEAARAGEHGQGFAVVANEVRRLAANSAEAAQKTEALVRGVLERVAESRELSGRAVTTVAEVIEATNQGMTSFAEVERGVADSEQWTAAIAQAADSSNTLVTETMNRLDELSRGTEAFAAAMEQVAASSQQQSASTEEIAAASTALGNAAGRLGDLIGTFKLDEDAAPSAPAASAGQQQRMAPAASGVAAPRRLAVA